jgi:hypothetical protein
VKLPAIDIDEEIKEIEDLILGLTFLNLIEFLLGQMLLKIDTMAAMIVS